MIYLDWSFVARKVAFAKFVVVGGDIILQDLVIANQGSSIARNSIFDTEGN